MKFTNVVENKQPISVAVSMVPFCEHDDQTRLQMSSSQMRQAIFLKDFDKPMIQSGCEGLYSHYTQFVKKAKKDGTVLHVEGREFIIVEYTDGTFDIFNIKYRKIYIDHMDVMNIYVKPGDKFKAGDILAESNFTIDGDVCIGKNLLTAIMPYFGDNYEDGIVISDRLVKENVLESVHFKDLSFLIPENKVLLSLSDKYYKPLPDPDETLRSGQTYAILKSLMADDQYSVFSENIDLKTKKQLVITEVNIYPNKWNKDIYQYDMWIREKIRQQNEQENKICGMIKNFLPKEQANLFIKNNNMERFNYNIEKYKEKKEFIEGIYVEMYGMYVRPIQVGDKLANRHGNKGVVSRIVPAEKMPKLPDGRNIDICINPLGIISRMNIGQLFELHLAMSLNDLKRNILSIFEREDSQKLIRKYLLGFIRKIDKTEKRWYYNQFKKQLPEIIDRKFIETLTVIQPPFESIGIEEIEKVMKYTKTTMKYKLHDPISKQEIINPISVGYLYFFRMVHIAEEKLAARGIGAYARRTLQPLGGRKNKGGQRCGEMETACLIAHDASKNLFEFLTTKSDCIDLKNKYIKNVIEYNPITTEDKIDETPESVKLLNAYLNTLGVDYND